MRKHVLQCDHKADTAYAACCAQGLDVERVVTPARIRAAIESTCKPLGGESPDAVLTYGRGLMQVRPGAIGVAGGKWPC